MILGFIYVPTICPGAFLISLLDAAKYNLELQFPEKT